MGVADGGLLLAVGQPVQGVGPDGLQHLPAAALGPAAVDQQALVGQPADQVGDHAAVHAGRDDSHGRVEVEAADERARPAEHGPLVAVEQVVAPVDDRPQRAVPLVRAAAAGQQAQVVVQPGQQAVHAERRAARRGQLDGQRHAVQPGAHVADHGSGCGEVAGRWPGPGP